jgi:RNA polymerase sigma-70 factor (ECF subfamily)
MFPTTRWTLILESQRDAGAANAALEQIASTYWRPLYLFLRRKGVESATAEDLVQGFFVQLLERPFVTRLDPGRGRLRSYLLTGLEHYRINVHAKETAQRRGGGVRVLSLDVALAERDLAAATEAPEAAYEREWALGVLERAQARLEEDYRAGRRSGRFETIRRFFGFDRAPSYAEAAAESEMTVVQFKASLHRARARYRELVREEIAATVDDPSDVDAELGELLRTLGS